jgi:hypothetical protein
MDSNQKIYHPSKVRSNCKSTFYLYEIWSIPLNIRTEYLQKHLKRKNSVKQKNVRLLYILYDIVEREDFHSWDMGKVCNDLELTVKQLYWHKSKILRDLRQIYFGWKEIEKELQSKYRSKNESEFLLIKGKNLYEIGMRKEAKRIFLKLDKTYFKKFIKYKLSGQDIINLSEVYEKLLNCYNYERNLTQYKIYFEKFENLHKHASRIKKGLAPEESGLITLNFLIASVNRHLFHPYNDIHVIKARELLLQALKLSEKFNFAYYRAAILYKLSGTHKPGLLSDEREIKINKYLDEGCRLSKKNGLKLQEYAFRSKIMFKYFQEKESENKEQIDILKDLYNKAEKLNPACYWTEQCLYFYSVMEIKYDMFKFSQLVNINTKKAILNNSTALAIYYLYMNKDDNKYYYLSSPVINGTKLIILDDIEPHGLNRLEILSEKALEQLRNTYFINYRIRVISGLLNIQFLKGTDFDFEKTISLIKKIDWALSHKELRKIIQINYYRFVKLSLQMFEDSKKYNSQNEIIYKYLKPFEEICNEVMKSPPNHGCFYLHITHVAKQLDIKEFWDVAEKHWHSLQKNYPAIIESLNRQLQRQQGNEVKAA